MSIDQWIAMISSIAGCLAAVAAFLAIRQYAKQREATYRPDIVVIRTPFKYSVEVEDAKDVLLLAEFRNVDDKGHIRSGGGWFRIPVRNVGLGAAKRVSVTWSYPFESSVAEANVLSMQVLGEELFSYKDGKLEVVAGASRGLASLWKNQRQRTYDCMHPSTDSSDQVYLTTPSSITMVVAALIRLTALCNDRPTSFEYSGIEIEFEYHDIGGKKHSVVVPLSIDLNSISSTGCEFTGSLQR